MDLLSCKILRHDALKLYNNFFRGVLWPAKYIDIILNNNVCLHSFSQVAFDFLQRCPKDRHALWLNRNKADCHFHLPVAVLNCWYNFSLEIIWLCILCR